MTDSAAAATIPLPPDFPVEWSPPEDAHRFWERETMHVPGQATQLDFDFMSLCVQPGFNAACEDYSFPVRQAYSRVNTYVYQAIEPVSHDPAVLQQLGEEAERRIGAALAGQIARWEGETLPELRDLLGRYEAFDLDGADDAALARHVHDALAWAGRAWHLHFSTVFPVLMSMSLFQDCYAEVVGGDDPYGAYRLLQGLDNMSLLVDRELYALSRRALGSAEVLRVLGTAAPAEVLPQLRGSGEGAAFAAQVDAFLAEHGRRLGLYVSLSAPSWIEQPEPLIATLQDAVTQPARDHAAELAAAAEEREARSADVLEGLAALPAAVRGQFEFLLAAAREGSILQEDHNYWLDCRVMYEMRRVVLAVGRRLAAKGLLDTPEDVFQLRFDELGDLGTDLRAVVADRKAELARFASVVSPSALGTLPPGPPPDNPIARAVMRMFGGEPPASAAPGTIRGMAGSPGVARGRVRVVRSLAEGEQLAKGEVLVAPTTAPPWTPLFGRAAAIVTDAGGILSHCAVVAREYLIPAVVGTKRATTTLHDGQLVEVDGTTGTVRVIEE